MSSISLSLPFIANKSAHGWSLRRQKLVQLIEKDYELLTDILELQRKLAKNKQTRLLADELGAVVQEYLSLNREKLDLSKEFIKES